MAFQEANLCLRPPLHGVVSRRSLIVPHNPIAASSGIITNVKASRGDLGNTRLVMLSLLPCCAKPPGRVLVTRLFTHFFTEPQRTAKGTTTDRIVCKSAMEVSDARESPVYPRRYIVARLKATLEGGGRFQDVRRPHRRQQGPGQPQAAGCGHLGSRSPPPHASPPASVAPEAVRFL